MVFNQFFVGLLTIPVTIVTMAGVDFFMMVASSGLDLLSLVIARFIAKRSYTLSKKQTKARGLQTVDRVTAQEVWSSPLISGSNSVRLLKGLMKASGI